MLNITTSTHTKYECSSCTTNFVWTPEFSFTIMEIYSTALAVHNLNDTPQHLEYRREKIPNNAQRIWNAFSFSSHVGSFQTSSTKIMGNQEEN